jgi:hypothetical protein
MRVQCDTGEPAWAINRREGEIRGREPGSEALNLQRILARHLGNFSDFWMALQASYDLEEAHIALGAYLTKIRFARELPDAVAPKLNLSVP